MNVTSIERSRQGRERGISESVTAAIAGGAIGALLATLIGFFLQIWFHRVGRDVDTTKELISDLRQIEVAAVEFWSGSARDPHQIQVLRIQLLALFASTAEYEAFVQNRMRGCLTDYQALDDELYDAVLGGDFEGKVPLINRQRAVDASMVSSRMRVLLREQARNLYWAH